MDRTPKPQLHFHIPGQIQHPFCEESNPKMPGETVEDPAWAVHLRSDPFLALLARSFVEKYLELCEPAARICFYFVESNEQKRHPYSGSHVSNPWRT